MSDDKKDEIFSLRDIFPVREDVTQESVTEETSNNARMVSITQDDEITTSYLLVNALLNLLLGKGIIRQSEVNELLMELHKQYRQNKQS